MDNKFPQYYYPEAEKTEEGFYKPTIDYYINQAAGYSAYRTDLQILYDAAEGIIDDRSYQYVLNPTNTQNDDYKRFPAKLRNYDIIGPVLELFLGEWISVNDDPPVVKFSGQDNSYQQRRLDTIRKYYAQLFVNELNTAGIETGVESTELPPIQEHLDSFESSYGEEKAILGQQALEYLIDNLQLDELLQSALYDWLVCGYVVTLKEVVGDDVEYTVCDPRDVNIIGLAQNGFTEDSEAVVYTRRWSMSEIVRHLDMTEAEIKSLDSDRSGVSSNSVVRMVTENIDDYSDPEHISLLTELERKYDVYYVVWQSAKMRYILTYHDPITGAELSKEVDSTYKLDKKAGDIAIDKIPTNCWYEGYRIGETVYKGMQEGLVQRNELRNIAVNKLPFNGRIRGYRSRRINSVVKTGLAYQVLYNIVHYRFEFTLAKSKDKLTTFPIGLIPRKYGWDEEKWFYWAYSNSIAFYDESAPGAAVALQGIKQIDLSLGQYIASMWSILAEIKNEFWDNIGMNRQRFGDTLASDGKATTEQAMVRSSVITEDMLRQLSEVLERDYQGLLDFAKVAWINGKQGFYINSDKKRAFLNIDGTEFAESSYAVFVKNNRRIREKMKEAQQLLLTFGQNGVDPASLLEILDSSNLASMKAIAEKALKAQREFEQSMAQQQQEATAAIEQMKNQTAQLKSEDTRYVADMQYQAAVDAAKIRANASLASMMNDLSQVEGDMDEYDKFADMKSSLHREMVEKDLGIKAEGANLKREQMANSLAIAKENKNKYDE